MAERLRLWMKSNPPFFALTALNALIVYWYFPELQLASLFYNDGISHISIIRRMDEVWQSGGNVLDFWMGHVTLGHPLLRSYQFFMHFLIWAASKTIFAWLSLEQAFNACILIFALALPWVFYGSGRLLGLKKLEALGAAFAATFIQEKESYGMGLHNFVFVGHGTYNQLPATVFAVLSFGLFHRYLRTGVGPIVSALTYAAAFMSHILTGYFALFWYLVEILWCAFALRLPLRLLIRRLAIFGGFVLLFIAHWLFPMIKDGLYQHRSVLENAYKWSGHGAEKILTDLVSGNLLDDSPIALLTVFLFIGVGASLRKSHRYFFILFFVALFISFGTATWGALLGMLPFSNTVHWHRAFVLLQIVSAFVIGIGLHFVWNWTKRRTFFSRLTTKQQNLLLVLSCALLLVGPLAKRQNLFRTRNVTWLNDTFYWMKNNPFIEASVTYALKHRDARYYVGRYQDHGNKLIVTTILPFYGLLTQFNLEMIGYLYHAQGHTSPLNVFFDWKKPSNLELMNIGYVALQKDMPAPAGWKPVLNSNNAVLYDLPQRYGYFWIGTLGAKGCANSEILHQSINNWIFSSLVERHLHAEVLLQKNCDGQKNLTVAVAEDMASTGIPTLPGTILETGKEVAPQSDRHWAKVKMNTPGLLVFKMNYHPNWIALVDGQPAVTKMVVPALLGIELGAGEHSVVMEYKPDLLKRALQWICVALYLVLGAWALLRWKKGRKRRNAEQ